jgi:hypothetical protein
VPPALLSRIDADNMAFAHEARTVSYAHFSFLGELLATVYRHTASWSSSSLSTTSSSLTLTSSSSSSSMTSTSTAASPHGETISSFVRFALRFYLHRIVRAATLPLPPGLQQAILPSARTATPPLTLTTTAAATVAATAGRPPMPPPVHELPTTTSTVVHMYVFQLGRLLERSAADCAW